MILNAQTLAKLTPLQLANFIADLKKHPMVQQQMKQHGDTEANAVTANLDLIRFGLITFPLHDDGRIAGTVSITMQGKVTAAIDDAVPGAGVAIIAGLDHSTPKETVN